jgi:hypothetical protein
MLRIIPTVAAINDDNSNDNNSDADQQRGMNAYFDADAIDPKLTVNYENLIIDVHSFFPDQLCLNNDNIALNFLFFM